MKHAGEGVGRIEQEILTEKAAALGRAGERLEAALAALRDAEQFPEPEPPPWL